MKKKSVNNILLITVGLILVLAFININIFNHLNDYLDKKNQYTGENLEFSDYSSIIEGSGEDINITLHQSLLNTSVNSISNISDPTINTFYEPCPKVENFNSSFVNISVEEIYAPNKTLLVEVDSLNSNLQDFTPNPAATSFKVEGDGYLENVSVYCREENGLFSTTVSVYLYNSTWNINTKKSEPDIFSMLLLDTFTIPAGETFTWYNVSNQREFLDNLKTENNTWFIGLTDGGSGDGRWYYLDDYNSGFPTDNDNETRSYQFNGLTWDLISNPLSGCNSVDLKLKVDLSPYIYPSSKELIVEDDTLGDGFESYFLGQYYVSFKTKSAGYIENISMPIKNATASIPSLIIKLYNASDSGGIPYPDTNLGLIVPETEIPLSSTYFWFTFNNTHAFYNSSKTYNNTFFLEVEKPGAGAIYWDWYSDGADADETYVYDGAFQLETFGEHTIDLGLKIGVAPLENVPRPENIGLKINNTAVIGNNNIHGIGYWNSTQEYSSSSGQLEFELSADWWDVSCKITKVQINYTRTDLKASSKFSIMESGQDIQWNVTRSGGLNFFDPRITHHNTINFTIPSSWDNVNVFNGPENKTTDIKTRLLNNGYRDVEIIDTTNGTFWYLTATSKNLVESIDMYISSNPIITANYSDVVEFNVTFNEMIGQNDGIINLSVYSPAAINDKLNFTLVNSTFDSGSEFYLGKWDLSEIVNEYGEFRVQIFWNNDTAAGFREKTLTITGQTDLTLIAPPQNNTYYTDQIFNITIYYEDSNMLTPIDGATIYYNIDGQGWQSTSSNNGTIGYYTISIDCSTFNVYGLKTVEITATKTYYENQTVNYNFNVICRASSALSQPPQNNTYYTDQIFNITIYYEDSNMLTPIDGATIYYNIDGQGWQSTSSNNGTVGYYTIPIDCSTFSIYGLKTVEINATKTYYENQTVNYNFNVICRASSALSQPTQNNTYYTDQSFNIIIYYEDSNTFTPIDGATIQYNINGQGWQSTSSNNGTVGYYTIPIDCSTFSIYGLKTVEINATKTYYENHTVNYNFNVICRASLALSQPPQNNTYYTDQIFNIIVYYEDSNTLTPIDGATIQYNINGQGWQSTSSNNGTIGYYIIPVNCSIFTIDGTKAVEITANKNYYESQTLDYNFNVIIAEENGKQGEEFPLGIIIITIISTVGGIGVAVVIIILLRKRKRISKGI